MSIRLRLAWEWRTNMEKYLIPNMRKYGCPEKLLRIHNAKLRHINTMKMFMNFLYWELGYIRILNSLVSDKL